MKRKITSVDEAVALVEPGMAVGLGGATLRRKPMALARSLARTGAGELDLWTWIGSLDVDLLIGAGVARRVNSAYVGFGAFGLAQTSRRAFADGSVEFVDWSESSLVASFRAGASDLPLALTRALLGTSMAEELGTEITTPLGGLRVVAVPAARPDIALIHAQSADEFGNVRRRRPNITDDIDHIVAASARRVIVSVEEIDAHEEIVRHRDEVIIPGHHVTAVCVLPKGAHPTGCDGFYDPEPDHLAEYAEASRSAEAMRTYLETFVYGISHHDYLERTHATAEAV